MGFLRFFGFDRGINWHQRRRGKFGTTVKKMQKNPFLLFCKEKRGLIATLILFLIASSGIKMVLSHHFPGFFCTCDAQNACVIKGFRTSPKPSKLIPTLSDLTHYV